MSFENMGPSVKSVLFCILTRLMITSIENGAANPVGKKIVRVLLFQEDNHSFTSPKGVLAKSPKARCLYSPERPA